MAKWTDWLGMIGKTPEEASEHVITSREIQQAQQVTDAIIKELSREWKVDVDEYRKLLFPKMLDVFNE